jgi:hypothetical protein
LTVNIATVSAGGSAVKLIGELPVPVTANVVGLFVFVLTTTADVTVPAVTTMFPVTAVGEPETGTVAIKSLPEIVADVPQVKPHGRVTFDVNSVSAAPVIVVANFSPPYRSDGSSPVPSTPGVSVNTTVPPVIAFPTSSPVDRAEPAVTAILGGVPSVARALLTPTASTAVKTINFVIILDFTALPLICLVFTIFFPLFSFWLLLIPPSAISYTRRNFQKNVLLKTKA